MSLCESSPQFGKEVHPNSAGQECVVVTELDQGRDVLVSVHAPVVIDKCGELIGQLLESTSSTTLPSFSLHPFHQLLPKEQECDKG